MATRPPTKARDTHSHRERGLGIGVSVSETTVKLFGKDIEVAGENGEVLFDRESFMRACGKERAVKLFDDLNDMFAFLGEDGLQELIDAGKSHLVCKHILDYAKVGTDLRAYAEAWVEASEKLRSNQ